MKKNFTIATLMISFSLMNTFQAYASEIGPAYDVVEEFNAPADVSAPGVSIEGPCTIVYEVNEIPQELLEQMESVNDPTADPAAETDAEVVQRIHYTVYDDGYPARLSDDLQDWVYTMCEKYGIAGHEKMIIAKLYCESGYRANCTHYNKNGTVDVGIAQINSCNHARLRRELGITDFYDPYQSIEAGVYIMSQCMAANGYDESMALVAYNTGRNGRASSSYSRRVLKIKDSEVQS